MPDYTCPHCRGGFDDPATPNGPALPECPWCGTPLDGEYDPQQFERVVSRVTDGGDREHTQENTHGLIARFFR